jgi:tetratricopeptide (TPR) repeat protein
VFTEVGAERRMYLPAMAAVVLIVVAAYRSSLRAGLSRLQLPAVAAVAIVLAAGTVMRNHEYLSPLTLWQTAVDRWPHGRARYHLGLELKAAGRRNDMYAQMREAVRDFPEAHYGLGVELFDDKQYGPAIAELEAFIAARPLQLNVIDAYELIGRALAAQGKPQEAITAFRTILKMTPGQVNAHGRIADVLFSQQRFAEAAEEYRQFLAVHGEQVGPWTNYAISLAAAGRDGEAIHAFERAVALAPDSASTHRNLANALLPRRQFDAAAAHAREAIRLAPRDVVAHDLLGLALLGLRRPREASAEFRAALAIDPTYADAREHLQWALR